MSAASEAVVVLNADTGAGGAAKLLTGGIYDYDDLPRKGINRIDIPEAYDSDGKLRPLAIVRERSAAPWTGRRDPVDGYVAVRVVVDITILGDGDGGWDTLKAARARIQALLDQHSTAGYWWLWSSDLSNIRDMALNDACLERATYFAYGKRLG
jgi:hypothetical protein